MPAAVAPVDKALPSIPPRDPLPVRRFELADLARHGGWLMERLLKAYHELSPRELNGWLRGIIYSNEFNFLCQPNSVALAQVVHTTTMTPKPVIYERFVFAESPEFIEQAAAFYVEFERWAKNQHVETIFVEEMTDVPHELIKKVLGTPDKSARLFTRQQVFVRV